MQSIIEKAQRIVLSTERVPSPSALLFKIIELMQDEKADARDIKSLFSKDPGISSCVLRMANSAYYGYRGRIKDLERAIVIIGFDEVKNICITAAIMQQFAHKNMSASFDHGLFWKHSLLVGILAKELAARSQGQQWHKGPYYTMGLLHDFGRLTIAAYLTDYFEKILKLAKDEEIALYEAENKLGLTHTQTGFWLASKWGFPHSIRQVIACHHDSVIPDDFSRETAIVRLANHMARYAQAPDDVPAPAPDQHCLKASGLNIDDYMEQLDRIFDVLSGVDGIYDALSGKHEG